MENKQITLEGLVSVIDSNYTPEYLKKKASEVLEYVLETAMPPGIKKVQSREILQDEMTR